MSNLLLFNSALILLFAIQFLLSTRRNKWLGVLLPLANVALALFCALHESTFYDAIGIFLLLFVPVIISTAIYLACRNKVDARRRHDLAQRNIRS